MKTSKLGVQMRMNRSTSLLWAAVCALVGSSGLLGLAIPQSGASQVQPAWVTYAEFAQPQSLGNQPAEVQEVAWRAAALADQRKEHFLGSYVTPAGRVVVVPATPLGLDLASARFAGESASIDIKLAGISSADATELGDQLQAAVPSLRGGIISWGGHPSTGGVVLTMRREATGAERTAIESLAAERQVPIQVQVMEGGPLISTLDNRLVDPSPYSGGAKIGIGTGSGSGATIVGSCSTGFGYVRNGNEVMLNAGHCFARDNDNDFMWILDASGNKWQFAGKETFSSWDNGVGSVRVGDNNFHGDLALVNVSDYGRDAGDHIWWNGQNTTDKIPVTSRHAPSVGDPVCFSGFMSGADCGLVVYAVNQSVTQLNPDGSAAGVLRQADLTSSGNAGDCPIGGDSGAPVVLNHLNQAETFADAKGVLSGGGTGTGAVECIMSFTGVEEAVQAWGGNLNTVNN